VSTYAKDLGITKLSKFGFAESPILARITDIGMLSTVVQQVHDLKITVEEAITEYEEVTQHCDLCA